MSRAMFRDECVERDGGVCIVPWCGQSVTADAGEPGDVHHIIERKLWSNGGYFPDNGVSICNRHHQMAEQNEIPPQAFWRWIGLDEITVPTNNSSAPDTVTWNVNDGGDLIHVDKWGESFETPPHNEIREYPKYPSTRHLIPLYWQSERGTVEQRTGRDDTGLTSVESFLDIPLVVTVKLDGSNAMLVSDADEPVRARNGRDAEHESFDQLKQVYWDRNVYENLPDHLQVFGENVYAKHSIHYGCPHDDCSDCDERNQGPGLDDVFYVFGVYDTRYELWLSWDETQEVARQIDFPTAPECYQGQFEESYTFCQTMTDQAEDQVDQGHEGIIVRSLYPFHYDQFSQKVGKYVRPNHVQTDEHWSHQQTTRNKIARND